MLVGLLTLLSALSISVVAIYYSVVGLTAIFSAAALAIMIMGVSLEVGKLVTVVWLHQNWKTAPRLIKIYLSTALVVLMLVTSMGIFGFLSKAHMDQSVPTGDVADKVALYDEKIKTQKENIDAYRKALRQMDESVDQVMARSSDEKGADKAAALRRSQQKERNQLQADIGKAQAEIAKLNNERAPIAKELRKVEAEVGPIKYIANFFYGDTDQSILEKAVTWVILTLIFVFDPLAIVLLIAAQVSIKQALDKKKSQPKEEPPVYEDDGFRFLADEKDLYPEDAPVERKSFWPTATSLWPFPKKEKVEEPIVETVLPDTDLEPDLLKQAEERVKENVEKAEEEHALEQWNKMIEEAEKEAEEESKRLQEKRLKDDAAEEAKKWAEEQEAIAEEEAKKKEVTYLEKDGKNQILKISEK